MLPLGLLFLAAVSAFPTKQVARDDISALFRRQDTTYPPADVVPDRASLPQAWLDKLAAANIPDIPVAVGDLQPTYPGREITDPEICSFTYECTQPDDLQTPPAGTLAITFDDGPAGGSDALLAYLKERGEVGKVTHFMIGSYITRNLDIFREIAAGGAHIAVHTWSHKYTTTLTNEQVVGELGWAMQIMADNNNGKIPMYWRPPFGDVDNRVRAIAKQVFGLETVVWSNDSEDWNLDQGRDTSIQSITDLYRGWLADKSKGYNVLHHEVRESQVEAFKSVHPALTEGWELKNIADAWGMPWYQNAATANGTVEDMEIGGSGAIVSASSSPSGSASASSASASSSAAGSSASMSASSTSTRQSTYSSASAVASNAAAQPSNAAGRLDATGLSGIMAVLGGLVMLL